MALYITVPPYGILPPRSTQELVVTRVAKKEAPELEDMQCKDKYFVWSCFVTQDVNASELTRYMPQSERRELPIIFTEVSFAILQPIGFKFDLLFCNCTTRKIRSKFRSRWFQATAILLIFQGTRIFISVNISCFLKSKLHQIFPILFLNFIF